MYLNLINLVIAKNLIVSGWKVLRLSLIITELINPRFFTLGTPLENPFPQIQINVIQKVYFHQNTLARCWYFNMLFINISREEDLLVS